MADVYFDCAAYDPLGNPGKGVLSFAPEVSGSMLETILFADVLSFNFTIATGFTGADVLIGSGEVLAFNPTVSYYKTILQDAKTSWIAWSKIGSADFTIDHTNLAGEMPIKHKGLIWYIDWLDDMIICYGENSIIRIIPKDVFFGYKTISTIGLLSRDAIVAMKNVHYFIDKRKYLMMLSVDKGVQEIGYNEQLSAMSTAVMTLDEDTGLIYICDGTNGFVFNPANGGFVQGPATITGISYQGGVKTIGTSGTISNGTFAASTDIMDMGTRKEKTIFNLEIESDYSVDLQVKIDARENAKGSFISTPWATFTHRGIAYIPCYGVEFIFHFRASEVEALKIIDGIKINGAIHGFSFLDTFTKR